MNKINIILIGNQGSGKTSVINRFLMDDQEDLDKAAFTHIYYPTIGINLERKTLKLKDNKNEDKEVNLHIWDTAGQEKFFSLTKNFFQRADGVAIIYDITDASSFTKIEDYWLQQVDGNCKPQAVKILIGNKLDLEQSRMVKREDGESLAKKYQNMGFFETSAKTGENVHNAMMHLSQLSYQSLCAQIETDNIFELKKQEGTGTGRFDCWDKFKSMWSKMLKNS